MLSWPTLEEGLAETAIPREAPEFMGRDVGVVVGEGAGITKRKKRKKSTRRLGARLVGVTPTMPKATCKV